MTKDNRRYSEINALYAIGIVLVLIGHSHSSDGSYSGTILQSIIIFIYTFHMPLFFSIAGFLFINSASFEQKGLLKWTGEKAIRLLVPYTFWSLLGLVPKYYVENKGFQGLTLEYILKSFFIPRLSVWGHFWFLPVLFFIYLIFGIWRFFYNKAKNSVVLFVLATIMSLAIYFIPASTDVLGVNDICNVAIYFVLGMIACTILKDESIHRAIKWLLNNKIIPALYLISAVVFSALFAKQAHSIKIIGLIVGIVMILACVAATSYFKKMKCVRWISLHNFTIYIFSWLFQSVAMIVCDHFHLSWIITFFIMFAIGAIGPVCIILIYEHIRPLQKRWIKVLLGVR